jgi:FixJ family two-component response regulator
VSCLVLDVRLPGISGLDLQAELATAQIRIPIVFITGYRDIPMTVKAMKAGAVKFLTKPVREQDLPSGRRSIEIPYAVNMTRKYARCAPDSRGSARASGRSSLSSLRAG